MATYEELFDILTFNAAGAKELQQKVGVATLITADKIRSGDDNVAPFDQTAGKHDQRLIWAREVFKQPRGAGRDVFGAVIAANASVSQTNILTASDTAIQSNVDAVADVLAGTV